MGLENASCTLQRAERAQKGGGWAYTLEDAYYRSLTTLGSSFNLTSTYGYDGGPISPIEADNPLFAGANRAVPPAPEAAGCGGRL